jgi:lysophospholipid acyltransferase (LPLAT)-like uncharacterized protein
MKPAAKTKPFFQREFGTLLYPCIGWIGSLVVRILIGSLRMKIEGEEKIGAIIGRGNKVIYAFWHGQMLSVAYTHRHRNIHILISDHRDGEIISQITKRLGFSSIRGSTTRGGARAVMNILTKLNDRFHLAITPDGPRGPRWKVQQGVIYIAQKTGLPIVPFVNGTDRFWELSTWDRFRIPKPFSKGLVIYGDPLMVPGDLDRDGVRRKVNELEDRLVSLSRELDARLGVSEVHREEMSWDTGKESS